MAIGLWSNACALGVVDEQIYITIEDALEKLGEAAAKLGRLRRIPNP